MHIPKTLTEARANFEGALGVIPERYKSGVNKADWATPAQSDQAEANFNAAMSRALSERRRQVNLKKVTNEEWRSGAINKGAMIIGERIRQALGKWEAKWGPMYDQVTRVVATLPPRTVDPITNIDQRSKATVLAWRKAAGK